MDFHLTSEELSAIGDQVTKIQKDVALIHLNPRDYGANEDIILKDKARDYTTAVDLLVENKLKPFLLDLIPGSGFLGEETAGDGENNRFVWIVDPTDGTAVFVLGGEYYSSSIALVDKKGNSDEGAVVLGSVYQSATGRQFLRTSDQLIVRQPVIDLDGKETIIERRPRGSNSGCFAEYKGASFGTSKYYPENPGIKRALEGVFQKVKIESLGRIYSPINARPASGSSALFCCDIADGNNHFGLIFFQKAWDLAVGALYAQQAGCPTVLFDNQGSIIKDNLEKVIAYCKKDTLANIGVFANEKVKEDILSQFYK